MFYVRSIVVRSKAERYIAVAYKIHVWELTALAFLWDYLRRSKKLTVGIDLLVCWSGSRRQWKKRMYESLRACITKGFVVQVKYGRGYGLAVSMKGEQVLFAFEDHCQRIDKNLRATVRKPNVRKTRRRVKNAVIPARLQELKRAA